MAVSVPLRVDPMRLADINAVHEIERMSFSTPWPSYAFEQELTGNRLARYVVARVAEGATERVVGFAGIWLMVDDAHITTFGVHPGWRRQGVGRRLLLRLVELAVEIGARRMTLEVRASNAAAQALYAGFGFVVSGQRRAYYTDDGEDAHVMTTSELLGPAMQAVLERERARRDREDLRG
jgi:ribosomal-protein-alanine N-acetyltransferase